MSRFIRKKVDTMRLLRRSLPAVAVLGAMLCGCAIAAQGDSQAAIKATLQSRFPDVRVEDVRRAPIAGMYEVFTGDRVVYTDETADHLFAGSVIDTRTKHDIAAERLDERLAIDFKQLPFDRAIKIVKGNGRRQLAIFADPDCPYCQQLEKELTALSDLTIYVFLFPLDQVHPDARSHSRAIWCSSDRAKSWTDWMLEHKPPVQAAACAGDPTDELRALGEKMYIASTPTLFLESGRRLIGVPTQANLEKFMAGAVAAPRVTPQAR